MAVMICSEEDDDILLNLLCALWFLSEFIYLVILRLGWLDILTLFFAITTCTHAHGDESF